MSERGVFLIASVHLSAVYFSALSRRPLHPTMPPSTNLRNFIVLPCTSLYYNTFFPLQHRINRFHALQAVL